MKKTTVIIFIIFFAYTISFAQQKNSIEIIPKIEKYLAGFENAGFSGTILIEIDGKKVISNGYGYRNLELKKKIHQIQFLILGL